MTPPVARPKLGANKDAADSRMADHHGYERRQYDRRHNATNRFTFSKDALPVQ